MAEKYRRQAELRAPDEKNATEQATEEITSAADYIANELIESVSPPRRPRSTAFRQRGNRSARNLSKTAVCGEPSHCGTDASEWRRNGRAIPRGESQSGRWDAERARAARGQGNARKAISKGSELPSGICRETVNRAKAEPACDDTGAERRQAAGDTAAFRE